MWVIIIFFFFIFCYCFSIIVGIRLIGDRKRGAPQGVRQNQGSSGNKFFNFYPVRKKMLDVFRV